MTQTPARPTQSAPVIDRTGLLDALDAARSAYAAGGVDARPDLAGRRFVVRQAFGCSGATPGTTREPGLATWRRTPKTKAIELTLRPVDWKGWAPAGEAEHPLEAVEGFWLERPWLRTDGCPAAGTAAPAVTKEPAPDARSPAAPPTRAPQTAGLAAVFEQGGSRLGRRDGKAFIHTIRGDDGPPLAPAAGYRVVLEGRFTVFPGGRAILCRAADVDERPVCIAAAKVDRIAFETADGQVLSEWRAG